MPSPSKSNRSPPPFDLSPGEMILAKAEVFADTRDSARLPCRLYVTNRRLVLCEARRALLSAVELALFCGASYFAIMAPLVDADAPEQAWLSPGWILDNWESKLCIFGLVVAATVHSRLQSGRVLFQVPTRSIESVETIGQSASPVVLLMSNGATWWLSPSRMMLVVYSPLRIGPWAVRRLRFSAYLGWFRTNPAARGGSGQTRGEHEGRTMIVGIDLGTSNSLVAVWRDGRHELVPNALGRMLTPSVVTLTDTGEIAVGQAARERLLTHPARTAAAFKRYMGSDHRILLGGRGFRPEELSAFVLKALKADAEVFLGHPVSEAVVTVPAYFSDAQRKATKAAGEIAGLRVERLLNEPTAAALAYGLNQLRETGEEARILVVDLGGGTFDVSILELFHGVMEVRASAGDNFLGGEDFVDVLVDAFIHDVGAAAGIPPRVDGSLTAPIPAHAVLRRQAEWTKLQLSDREEVTLEIPHEGAMLKWPVTQARFAGLSAPLLRRLRAPLVRAVRDARLNPDEITHVVLAGGATRMPEIRKMIARTFGKLPFQTINPDEVVARGAAVQAGLKMRDAALEEVVMTDVAPFSLGIDTSRSGPDGTRQFGLFSPILERNTVIPASREENYTTVNDNQHVIEISIYQGESRMVRDNVKLGEIRVDVPRRKAGEETIRVRFTYDVSGLLEVIVTVVSTGEKVETVIEGNPGVLTPEQIAERRAALANLKIHPRDQSENMGALARAERLYEENLGRTRDMLGEMIADFLAVLDRQDPREIEMHRTALDTRLTAMDRSPFD